MIWWWIGILLAVLLISLGGLAYMKLRPVDESTGEPRSTRALERQRRAVMTALMDESNAPQTAYALRTAAGLSSESFQALTLELKRRGLLETHIPEFDDPDHFPLPHYRLTDHGVAAMVLPGGDHASGRHRA